MTGTGDDRRPLPGLVIVAAAYVTGMVAGATLGGPWWLTGLAAAALALAWGLRPGTAGRWLVLGAAVLVAAGGHARVEAFDSRPAPPLAAMRGIHEVVGVVRDDGRISGTNVRVDLDVETVDGVPMDGGVRLTLTAPFERLRRGERLRVVGRLDAPPEVEAFDYGAYLRSRGIFAVVSFPRDWERIGHASVPGWLSAIHAARRVAVEGIERTLPDPAAALAAGVLVGERRALPPEVVRELRVTGTTHLVVISG